MKHETLTVLAVSRDVSLDITDVTALTSTHPNEGLSGLVETQPQGPVFGPADSEGAQQSNESCNCHGFPGESPRETLMLAGQMTEVSASTLNQSSYCSPSHRQLLLSTRSGLQ